MVSHLASILNNSGVLVADPSEEHEAVRNREGPLWGEQGKWSMHGTRTGEIRQEDATVVWHASLMGEGRLDLENVVCHLPGGNVPLGGENARDGVLPKAEAQGRRQDLAITLAQRRSCTARPQYRTSEELLVRCKRSWEPIPSAKRSTLCGKHRNLVQIPSS